MLFMHRRDGQTLTKVSGANTRKIMRKINLPIALGLLLFSFGGGACHTAGVDLANSRVAFNSLLEEVNGDWEYTASRNADGSNSVKFAVKRTNGLDALQKLIAALSAVKF